MAKASKGREQLREASRALTERLADVEARDFERLLGFGRQGFQMFSVEGFGALGFRVFRFKGHLRR